MKCAAPMGHLALPNKDGVLTYTPIRCNDEAEHDFKCSYVDYESGLMVTQFQRPSMTIDGRGCVIR